METKQKTAILDAVKSVGGQSQLAKLLNLSTQAVNKWCVSGVVPPSRVLKIEEITGVSRSLLRPDLYPIDKAA